MEKELAKLLSIYRNINQIFLLEQRSDNASWNIDRLLLEYNRVKKEIASRESVMGSIESTLEELKRRVNLTYIQTADMHVLRNELSKMITKASAYESYRRNLENRQSKLENIGIDIANYQKTKNNAQAFQKELIISIPSSIMAVNMKSKSANEKLTDEELKIYSLFNIIIAEYTKLASIIMSNISFANMEDINWKDCLEVTGSLLSSLEICIAIYNSIFLYPEDNDIMDLSGLSSDYLHALINTLRKLTNYETIDEDIGNECNFNYECLTFAFHREFALTKKDIVSLYDTTERDLILARKYLLNSNKK